MSHFGLKTLTKTLAVAGTRETLGTRSIPATSMLVAMAGNAGSIFVGGSDVSASNGYWVSPTRPLKLQDIVSSGHTESFLLSNIYAVSTEAGDGLIILMAERG